MIGAPGEARIMGDRNDRRAVGMKLRKFITNSPFAVHRRPRVLCRALRAMLGPP